MKKILVLLSLLLIFGCSTKENIEIQIDDVHSIEFHVGTISYEIKEDKYEEIVSLINEQELVNGSKIADESFWSIDVHADDIQTIGIQPNGNIVIENDGAFYEYIAQDKKLYDLFTEVMGKEIFHGLLLPFDDSLLENEWVYDNDIRNIFFVNVEEVEEINIDVFKDKLTLTLKEDQMDEFVESMNSTGYFECLEGGFYGGYPARINIKYKDGTFLTINVLSEGIDGNNAIHFILEMDEEGIPTRERSYRIKSGSNLFNAFKEVVGKDD